MPEFRGSEISGTQGSMTKTPPHVALGSGSQAIALGRNDSLLIQSD
jgi:hypothetical protein